MDSLRDIIQTLSLEDKKEFKGFINRLKQRKNRKDLELFSLLSEEKEYGRDDILKAIYPESNNLEAYHATRKRLIKHLSEFINLKRVNEDITSVSQIMSLYSLSMYLFEKRRNQTAWLYIKKAEQLAKKGQHFNLLNNIYSTQIANSQSKYSDDINLIIGKKDQNFILAIQDDNANTANNIIRNRLNIALVEGKDLDIELLVKEVLDNYNLTKAVTERPKLMFNIIAITRSAILAKKDYHTFEPYIIKAYNELESSFDKHSHSYKINILYMVAHTLYRNKKFDLARVYMDRLHDNLLMYNKSYYAKHIIQYTHLRAANLTYSGKVEEAIDLLLEIKKTKECKLDSVHMLNTYLNLSVYFFLKGDKHNGFKTLGAIQHTDKWCAKLMGKEWVLKKNLVELLLYCEIGELDLFDSRIRSIERGYRDFLERPSYVRVKVFIDLIKVLANNPSAASSQEFVNKVDSSFDWLPTQYEDLQAMTFYAWIKSKMTGGDFYKVLLELVKADD